MSHDRGCFRCGDDPPYDNCKDKYCPKGNHNKMKLNEENDFGFSFEDSYELKSQNEKLIGLKNMIMPLLNNLMKNPEKDTILWPNRKEKIQEFIAKMDTYINS